jgi:exopolysaccharide biosynthesis polyprenyl glycosylphosphotransferase
MKTLPDTTSSGTAPARIRLRRESEASPRLALAAILPVLDLAALVMVLVIARRFGLLAFVWAAVTFLALRSTGTQAPRINPRLADSVGVVLASIAVPLVALALLTGSPLEAGQFLVIGPVAAVLVLLTRGVTYTVFRAARSFGMVREPTLIIGAGEVGQEVARTLRDHPEYGLVPVGFLDDVEDGDLPLPILGGPEDLEPVAREFSVRRVIIAFGLAREPRMVEILRASDRLPVEVHLVPRFFELGVSAEGPYRDDVWGIPLVRLRRSALRSFAWRTKRIFDLLVGTGVLVAAGPVMLLLAGAVRLSSPGPILFRQTRVGQRGEPFQVLKFRTLRVNEDSDVEWSPEGDERVTWMGRVLRRTSMDELPQILNVLRGHMSLIGPRPERPYFVDRFSAEVARYQDRHRVPVGITGWAQVHGLRGDTSIPERVRFDNYYIEQWSLWTDLVILVRTVWLIITGRH